MKNPRVTFVQKLQFFYSSSSLLMFWCVALFFLVLVGWFVLISAWRSFDSRCQLSCHTSRKGEDSERLESTYSRLERYLQTVEIYASKYCVYAFPFKNGMQNLILDSIESYTYRIAAMLFYE